MSFLINPYRFSGVPIPTENLIFYLGCENTVADDTGNLTGANAPVNNGISFGTSGVETGSYYAEWNANTDNIQIPDQNVISFGDGSSDSPFSISFSVYFSSTTNNPRLIDKRGGGGNEYRVVMVSDRPRIVLTDNSAGATLTLNSTFTFTTGIWYFVAYTYDGSGTVGGLTSYLNGSDDSGSTATSGTYTAMENGTSDLIIGKDNSLTANTLSGRMDSIAFWDKELSAEEVTAIYNKINGGTELV